MNTVDSVTMSYSQNQLIEKGKIGNTILYSVIVTHNLSEDER